MLRENYQRLLAVCPVGQIRSAQSRGCAASLSAAWERACRWLLAVRAQSSVLLHQPKVRHKALHAEMQLCPQVLKRQIYLTSV